MSYVLRIINLSNRDIGSITYIKRNKYLHGIQALYIFFSFLLPVALFFFRYVTAVLSPDRSNYFLFFFPSDFLQAVGLAAVVLAIWMLTDQTFLVSLAQEQHNFNSGLYILLAAGLVMLVVAFLGCCGAFRESQCMLVGFFSCLLVVIVAQIAAGVWLYTNSDRLEELVKTSVINTVKVSIVSSIVFFYFFFFFIDVYNILFFYF